MSHYRIVELDPGRITEYVRLHIDLINLTYAHLVGPEFAAARRAEFDERCDALQADISESALASVAGRPPHRQHWVAENKLGNLVGVVCSGEGVEFWEAPEVWNESHPDPWTPPASTFILSHLYTVPGVHGTGLGQRMLDVALPARRSAYLWAFAENRRATRFYARNGFTEDGFHTTTGPEWGNRPMLRMAR